MCENRRIFSRQEMTYRLMDLVAQMVHPLQAGIRAAHESFGVSTEDFLQGLGTPVDPYCHKVLIWGGAPAEDSDPYSKMSLSNCLKYLLYGGFRRLGQDHEEYAMDQDLFFAMFDIPVGYQSEPGTPWKRRMIPGDYPRALLTLLQMYHQTQQYLNHRGPAPCWENLPDKAGCMITLLQPLCDTRWEFSRSCRELMKQVVQERFSALDAEMEDTCCKPAPDGKTPYRKGLLREAEDPQKAFTCYLAAAEQGHRQAVLALARCCRKEMGTRWDIAKTIDLCRELAGQGWGEALYVLGTCYQFGCGVRPNLRTAEDLYLRAKQLGCPGEPPED